MLRKILLPLIGMLVILGCNAATRSQQAVKIRLPNNGSETYPTPLQGTITASASPVPASTPTLIQPTTSPTLPAEPGMNEQAHTGEMLVPTDHEHLEAGSHLKLASKPEPTERDRLRARQIGDTARQALEKYRAYKAALQDGYQIFAPEVPQDVYHFINYNQAMRNFDSNDPARPTALLYRKAEDGYEWVGVMYSASWGSSEAELDKIYPLGMGQWHAHVNICIPPKNMGLQAMLSDPRFGFEGSIKTPEACKEAGGRFYPQIFGWMIHVEI